MIDVGMNRTDDGLVGRRRLRRRRARRGAITPVPGGVGQMTIAMLLHNTLAAARLQAARAGGSRAASRAAVRCRR